jgi:predicted nucleic acid-binding protein
MPQLRYLVDTNILLRLTNRRREQYRMCQDAIRHLRSKDCLLYYTLQNAAEFWNVSTRPVERNGHGLSVHEAAQGLDHIEGSMTLLPDDARVYAAWRELITAHDVRGVQVHDAKLAAAMLAHDVFHILTFNGADFARYPTIEAVHPSFVRS